jgi:2-methylisocitrate lyase-like PEP mutase family enzyme
VTADALRAMLTGDRVTHVPGVWDPAGAALAVRAGSRAVHLSGAAVSATMLGRPDLGMVPATQIADRAAVLGPVLNGVPLLADADAGFEDPGYAVWVALAYRRAGIDGLIIGDRVRPPGPAMTGPAPSSPAGPPSGELLHASLAAARLGALARDTPEIMVIARTDAYATGGLRAVIDRCRAYAAAGADAVLPEGVDGRAELGRLRAALPGVRLVVSRSESAPGGTAATDAELADLGVTLVLHPMTALLAALRAASLAYGAIAGPGDAERIDRMPWTTFTALTGDDEERQSFTARYARGRSAASPPDVARVMRHIDRLGT